MIYLDNGATAKVLPSAASAALYGMTEDFANPSSSHRAGQKVKAEIENIRKYISSLSCGYSADELFFTSCGTESNNIAINGLLSKLSKRGGRVLVSSIEHASVTNVIKEWKNSFEIAYLEPDSRGCITEDEIKSKVTADTVFVSLMRVNNETGALCDVSAIRKALKSAGSDAVIHSDCVAAFGKVPLPSKKEADLISVSGHKIGSAKGIGLLFSSQSVKLRPLILGGGQEKGLRSGTENVPAIYSLGAACHEVFDNFDSHMKHYDSLFGKAYDLFSNIDGIYINSDEHSSHAVFNFSYPGIPSEVMVRFLQDKEIYLSPASACSNNKGGHSSVTKAMRLSPERQKSAVRASFGTDTTPEDIEELAKAVIEAGARFIKKK